MGSLLGTLPNRIRLRFSLSPTLRRDISTFTICFKTLVRKGVIAMPFAYCTKALSARRLGFSSVKPGIASRPSLVGGLHAARWFQNTLTSTKKTRNDVLYVDDTTAFSIFVIKEPLDVLESATSFAFRSAKPLVSCFRAFRAFVVSRCKGFLHWGTTKLCLGVRSLQRGKKCSLHVLLHVSVLICGSYQWCRFAQAI